ncbi:MAG: activator of HSP90 ATPase 1 family protein [Bacteroidetes bacterium]|nr:MAG: activator of HSP90 ATPase 1 family protein [Bacteroidota bacterium]PTM11792.1 MAG: activator of HSP90 ATPase 1 family protein [Bacteroidota bacterium]
MNRVKFTVEFIFRASPGILYNFLSTPACLTRWFCDEVDINDREFTFFWSGAAETAELIEDIENELLRFHWEEAEDEKEYLEFKLYKSPVTDETVLEVTDYCDEDDLTDQRQLWMSQIERLRQETGG